jgi:hypothetical protein
MASTSAVSPLQHLHIPVAAAHGGLIDQQHPAAAVAPVLGDKRRPRPHQVHHRRPAETVATGDGSDRHHPRVGDDRPRQAAGEAALELGVLLQVALAAVVADETPPPPHQDHRPARHGQVPHPAPTEVMHPPAGEAAEETARQRTGRGHRDHQLVDRVDCHRQEVDQPQVQPDLHRVGTQRGLEPRLSSDCSLRRQDSHRPATRGYRRTSPHRVSAPGRDPV